MKSPQPRVLVAHRSPEIAQAIAVVLKAEGFTAVILKNGRPALQAIATSSFSIVVIEKTLAVADDGRDIVRQARVHHPRLKALYLCDRLDWPCGQTALDSCITVPCTIRDMVGCLWELHYRDTHSDEVAVPRFDIELRTGAERPTVMQKAGATGLPTEARLHLRARASAR